MMQKYKKLLVYTPFCLLLCTFAQNILFKTCLMDNYIVSARKYRPATFASVVGQKALTVTLKNAIANGKLAHAYLFCGPRGVGKTTCARIFAKTINCLCPTPEGEACNECESCRGFNEQRSFNIHELDAASNNSVEDIRSLIEQVRIPPQIGQYKVYIIDEVHMLSQAAFNAFLKTLEEPPHHAIFILATTEKHKILPTILSRCQIYDFSRITVDDIVEHLSYVAAQENIQAEPEALNIIAQKADGGMRDALSIFDQVASFTNGNITYKGTIENLNVLDYEYYFQLTDFLLKLKIPESLLLFNDVLNKGFDGNHFITGLASHFRDLLVSHDESTLKLLQVGASIRERYRQQASCCPVSFLYKAMKLCNDCDLNYRASKNKRLLVELTLIQIAQLNDSESEDVGCGRSPKKSLKPLFTKSTEKAQPKPIVSATPQQPVTPQVAGQSVASQSVHAPSTSVVQTDAPDRKIPTIKNGSLNISITRPAVQEPKIQPQAQPTKQSTTTTEIQEDYIVYEKDLEFYWRQYSNQLPTEMKALAGRMQNSHPHLLKDATFEVAVDNEMVQNLFLENQTSILNYMREQLHNRKINMTIRVSEPTENVRVYSRVDRFKMMNEKNPALLRLKQEFGLELY